MDNIPVLIRPETFCKAFLAEARVFRYPLFRELYLVYFILLFIYFNFY